MKSTQEPVGFTSFNRPPTPPSMQDTPWAGVVKLPEGTISVEPILKLGFVDGVYKLVVRGQTIVELSLVEETK